MHHILLFLYVIKLLEKENLCFLEIVVSGKDSKILFYLSYFIFVSIFLALPLAEIAWDKDGEMISIDFIISS